MRKGDNLYSDSAIAVDADSGELKWYFQFTPWDVHDWDAIQVPILADLNFNGEPRKLMLWANRNAFYYTLDREDGEFLVGTPYARQNWAERARRERPPHPCTRKTPHAGRERRVPTRRGRHKLVVCRL